jgi:iron complex outermembrane receptor protein
MNLNSVRKSRAPLALILGVALFAVSGNAQTSAPQEETTVKLDKFVVTGSYIPAAADEAKALPVQVIDVSAIEMSGVDTNIMDVLRKTVPQIQGGNNIGIENANVAGAATNGGSQISLRNIDTLVLIDGKRVAASAVAASGEAGTGGEFVDLNLVPISAVERIEVLTDGASAIYGTDAVSGVINIILRKDYQGAELGFHMTMAPKDTGGYWRERSISATAGVGDAKTHLMFSAEWSKSQPLWQRDTSYDNPYFGTASIPGIINSGASYYQLKPGLNAPTNTTPTTVANLVAQGIYIPLSSTAATQIFNLSGRPTVMNAVDKRIVTVAGSHVLNDQITLKSDFLYGFTETNYQLNPQPVTASSTTLLTYAPTYVAPITDSGFTIRNRFLGGPNRIYDNQTNFYRMTAELDGKVNDYFNWQVYGNYNLSQQTAYGFNQILNSALLNALKAGQINLFAITQDNAKLATANVFGTSIASYRSQLYTYDALANGKIWDLPAGPLQYAAGVEYRKESLVATADMNSIIPPGATTSLWNSGTSLAPFAGQRNVKSEYAELKVPVTSPQNKIPGLYLLTLDGAWRHEEYSDGNKTSVPKVSLRYLPFDDQLAFRATYAKSFTAPTLYDLYGPSASGFTAGLGGLNVYNSSGVATGAKFAPLQGYQINGFNSLLTPSHAKSKTFGVIYSPKYAKGLEITVDYYDIKQTDLIGSPGGTTTMVQSVEALGAASPFSQYVTLNDFGFNGGAHVTGPGQLSPDPSRIYVIQNLVNIASQKQHGWDLNVRYTLPWQTYGRFVVNTEWAILKQFLLISGPTDPGTDYSGYDDYGTLPKARSYTTVDWDYQGYGATLGYTHINHVDNYLGDWIHPYNTLDLQFRLNLGKFDSHLNGISMNIGVNNLTNQSPPLDRDNYASPPFDGSAYSFFGRIYYMDLRIKF